FVSMSSEETDDAKEYVDNLTKDIFEANIYVFTPKGKVIELPAGSTPVDFAYRIHTKVGDTTVGALVNGVMVPLNTILNSGDMVEIKTNKNSHPSEGWLNFVQTSTAKTSIRKYISKKNADLERDEKIAKGRQSLSDAFEARGIEEEEMMKMISDRKLLDYFECKDTDDLFIKLCGRKPAPSAILDYLNIKKPVIINPGVKFKTKNGVSNESPVYTTGGDNIAISLASCCTPIPGDDIVGFITRGKGITVHRKNCPNIINSQERLVDVYWRDDIEQASYPVDILIEASDRQKLLLDIMATLANHKVNCTSIHAKLIGNSGRVSVNATILVSDALRLEDIINILRNINGVYDIRRVIH
ncbi:MAG: TGS domain-containing protein, partial [Coprobacillus sp.]|nr:TGS domain-containing protein [Coprobacillus sp.]